MISYDEISKKSFHGYIWIWISQYISLIGSNIVSFAVIWYLTLRTESSFILSLASIASIVPMILVGPFAGVISDRVNKNTVLILADFIQALGTFVLIVLFYLNLAQLWHIIALLAVRGTCQGFQMPVAISITSLMVPKEKIKFVNSLNQILSSLMNIASPAIGAVAIASFSIEQIYWLDVFTFIPTAIVLLVIQIPSVRSKSNSFTQESAIINNSSSEVSDMSTNHNKKSFKQDFREGFNYIKKSGLSPVFVMFALANFIVVPVFTLFPLFILEYHNGGASEYSWVEILFQVGLIFGAILLMLSKRQGSMKSVIISGMMLSVVLLGLALVPRGWFWLFFIICFIMGINLAYIDTQLISVLQTTIPKDLQGRVFATMFTLIKAMNPIGLIIWGLIGEMIPVVWIFLISPSISLVVYFLLIKFTKMMHYDEKSKKEDLNTNEIDLVDESEFIRSNISKEEVKPLVE